MYLYRIIKILMVTLIYSISYAKENTKQNNYNFVAWYSPPYSFLSEKGKPQGLFIEVVSSVCKKLKAHCSFEIIPYRRLLNYAENGKVYGAFPLAMTKERKEVYIFSIPLASSKLGLFVKKDNPVVVSESNYNKILNNYIVSSFGPSFTFSKLEEIKKNTPNMEIFMDIKIETSFVKFNKNHFETESKEKKSGVFVAKVIGENIIKSNKYKNIRYAGDLSQIIYHIAFFKNRRDLNFVKNFNITLNEMKNNGELDKIIKKY